MSAAAPLSYLEGYGARAYPVVALTWGLMAISITVTVIVTGLVVWGVLARRRGSAFGPLGERPVERGGDGLRWISIGLGVSCLALLGALVWTVKVLAEINEPGGRPPLTVEVTGRQWWWQVRYLGAGPGGGAVETANEIHIPTGAAVRFRLEGGDVIHSFWVPGLGGKTDTIPGRTNVAWLEADRPGRYAGQCAEFCGLQHGGMALQVVAEPPAVFNAWLAGQAAAAPKADPATADGRRIFLDRCGRCHTVRGLDVGRSPAPDLTHLMSRASLAAGAAPNTAAGLSGWIANPQGVKPGALMPAMDLTGPQLGAVTAYLETLK